MELDRNKLIGERVRFYRTTRELSMGDVCRALPHPITPQQLARYETALSRWPADLLIDIAVALGLDIRLLTGLEDGKHEGKDNAEWDAERYKMLILKLPDRARGVVYQTINSLLMMEN